MSGEPKKLQDTHSEAGIEAKRREYTKSANQVQEVIF